MKALTVELFLGVLALAAVEGCTARKAEPESAPSAAPAAATVSPPRTEAAPHAAQDALDAKDAPQARPLVDAGVETSRKPAAKGAQAACGAGGCSADMKKGTK